MPQKKYKLFLINPKLKYHHYGVQKELTEIMGKKYFNFSIALPLIAALTPKNYKIKIFDESVDRLPEKELPDIVGLTAFTFTKKRCYEIADHYRSKGVPVVVGGAHASFCHEEVLEHADSVIIGEAEPVWEECLRDFENGRMKRIYRSDKFCQFKTSPIPRWDLIDKRGLNIIGVQATRGCPFRCEFCIVGEMLGTKHRHRDVNDVIKEIKSLPLKRMFFVDDNLTWNKKYMLELLAKMKPLNISWACNASIEIGDDPDFLNEMAAAGCLSIFIGFESLNAGSLKETKKYQNTVSEYERKIANIHKAGIQIIASFVVGFDNDRLDIYDKIHEFTLKNNLLFANIYFLLPVPGSVLEKKVMRQKRSFDIDPDFLNANFPCFSYKNFTGLQMFDKYHETISKMFSVENMGKKVLNLLESGNFKRKSAKDVKPGERLSGAAVILKRLYFSGDEEKKQLFVKLFNLGRNKIASWDNIAYLSLALLGFDEYLAEYNKIYPGLRAKVKKFKSVNNEK